MIFIGKINIELTFIMMVDVDRTERIISKINPYVIMMLNGKCKTDFRVKNEGNRSFHKQNSNPFER